jgi:phosphatidylinositol glycan class K
MNGTNDNWAVLISASRYWFNYRHSTNALILYRQLRQNGFSDERIILMLADDAAGNSRNKFPNQIFHASELEENLFIKDIQIDYKGRAVTKDSFTKLMLGEHPEWVSREKRLLSGPESNVLVFLTGHGGDNFFKFQDFEEMTSQELSAIFGEMHKRRRYGKLLFFMDTCQAATMVSKLNAPNIFAISTSLKGQSSYSDVPNEQLGLPLVDRFAKHISEFLREKMTEKTTVKNLVSSKIHLFTLF